MIDNLDRNKDERQTEIEEEEDEAWNEMEYAAMEYLTVAKGKDAWETTAAWYALCETLGRILERVISLPGEGLAQHESDSVLVYGVGLAQYERWHGFAPFRCGLCGSVMVGAGYGPPGCTSPHVAIVTWACPACLIRGITAEAADQEN